MANRPTDRIVVIGGGGHAKVLVSVLKKTGVQIAGYTDPQDRGAILGVSHLGDDDILPEFIRANGSCQAAVGLGKTDLSSARMRLWKAVRSLGVDFPVIISPQSVINEEVELAAGTVVFDGAVVNSGTVTGHLCILNTNSTVEHDCRLGDNVHVAPSAILSGGVTIGDNCMIGAGATVVQGVTICAECLIGAGSTVIADITSPGIYVGNPARRAR